MADFNKPVGSDGYADLLQNLRELFAELAKQLDASSASNVPTGSIRYNSTTKRREKYNGTSWVELQAKASGAYDERVAQADKLTTPRTITLSGVVGGSANFDGSANVTITVTMDDASTTAKGRVELATDAEAITGTDATRAVTPAAAKAAIDAAAYTHPTGDGNLHVPATGTANSGKVLTAGATAGSASWQPPAAPADASTTTKGIVELATEAETTTGTDAVRATTPVGVAAAIAVAVAGLDSGDYVVGSTPLVFIAEILTTEFSSFGTILPAGYPPITPMRVFGQAGFVSGDPYKGAYYWVADRPGEATFSVDVAKDGANAVIRWCKNGAALESEITHSSTSYGTYTKTVSFNAGDCISVQVRDTSSSSSAMSKNFKVLIG